MAAPVKIPLPSGDVGFLPCWQNPQEQGLPWAEQKLLGPHSLQTQTSNGGHTQRDGLLICQTRNAFHEF